MSKNIKEINNQKYKEWIQKQTIVKIPLNNIILTEDIHMKSSLRFEEQVESLKQQGITQLKDTIIIKQLKKYRTKNKFEKSKLYNILKNICSFMNYFKISSLNQYFNKSEFIDNENIENGNIPIYGLISGYKTYMIGKMLNIKKMNCVILDKTRDEYFKEVRYIQNFAWMDLKEIVIPNCFSKNQPNPEKLNQCRNYYNEFGQLDKPIVVSKKDKKLKDNYSRYCIAKEKGVTRVRVEFI